MKSRHRNWFCVAACGLAFILASASYAGPARQCNSFSLPVAGPQWISSSAWIGGRSELATVDPIQNRVFVFSPDAKLNQIADPQLEPQGSRKFFPVYLLSTKDGYLLKLLGSEALLLDDKLQVRSQIDLAKTSRGAKNGSRSFYQLAVAGDTLLSYGSVTTSEPGKSYKLGFFLMPLSTRGTVSMVLPFDSGNFYLLGHPYLTSLGSDSYFLLMTDQPKIFRVPSHQPNKLAPLGAFPEGFRKLPVLTTPMTGPETAAALFSEIETLSLPVGLYGYEKFLYVLTRQPVDGHSQWSLFKIDPKEDRLVDQLVLPTSLDTHHISLVFSPDFVFILEKGRVQEDGRQRVKSIVRFPSSWLTDSSASPINLKSTARRDSLCQTARP
jgi:hypothetical protein